MAHRGVDQMVGAPGMTVQDIGEDARERQLRKIRENDSLIKAQQETKDMLQRELDHLMARLKLETDAASAPLEVAPAALDGGKRKRTRAAAPAPAPLDTRGALPSTPELADDILCASPLEPPSLAAGNSGYLTPVPPSYQLGGASSPVQLPRSAGGDPPVMDMSDDSSEADEDEDKERFTPRGIDAGVFKGTGAVPAPWYAASLRAAAEEPYDLDLGSAIDDEALDRCAPTYDLHASRMLSSGDVLPEMTASLSALGSSTSSLVLGDTYTGARSNAIVVCDDSVGIYRSISNPREDATADLASPAVEDLSVRAEGLSIVAPASKAAAGVAAATWERNDASRSAHIVELITQAEAFKRQIDATQPLPSLPVLEGMLQTVRAWTATLVPGPGAAH
mmetsp:Transcript_26378/g.71256  ORF Transcript_26378/g.71256 Transcript_26378/m.71256 type:complete len:393 (+) Transcript_26378:1320-2498(+)